MVRNDVTEEDRYKRHIEVLDTYDRYDDSEDTLLDDEAVVLFQIAELSIFGVSTELHGRIVLPCDGK